MNHIVSYRAQKIIIRLIFELWNRSRTHLKRWGEWVCRERSQLTWNLGWGNGCAVIILKGRLRGKAHYPLTYVSFQHPLLPLDHVWQKSTLGLHTTPSIIPQKSCTSCCWIKISSVSVYNHVRYRALQVVLDCKYFWSIYSVVHRSQWTSNDTSALSTHSSRSHHSLGEKYHDDTSDWEYARKMVWIGERGFSSKRKQIRTKTSAQLAQIDDRWNVCP